MYSVHDRVIVDNMSEFEHESKNMKKNEKKASTGYLPETAQKIISFKEKLQEIVQQFRSKKTNSALQASYFFHQKKTDRRA